jgi:hypothetical membrane protein
MKERIDKIKNTHYIVSALLFVVTLIFCNYTASDLKLINISLSQFGIYNKIGFFWNASLFLIGITLLIEVYINVNKHSLGRSLFGLFLVAIIGLLLTASINMTYRVHFYAAYSYFIGFTLGMFLFGYRLIKTDFRIGITSIIIAIVSVVVPVGIVMYLHSFAIPELTHTVFVFSWIMITRFDMRYKNFLRRLGL